jgi:hypothetical protein
MRLLLKISRYGALLAAAVILAQDVVPPPIFHPKDEPDHKLPNGKSQNEAILKADYEKSLKDAAELVSLSQALQKELQNNDSHVLSVESLKKAEEIEKIAKRVRGRLRRF